ncbi:insulinase family protein [Reichenbachiella carrageenanivorans]|uniref:Insulinase family protein n=1 Tax=Reichenbachiella carrageenanivorans TaxID=2979869 RepID=A0ABY6CZZ8_9BACT|nr:pitrilysin family protein [Reichenbachiella carrageenanivorans]UXX79477.1 insulinase family protein [Reichenbachiella carrageenanivorans]
MKKLKSLTLGLFLATAPIIAQQKLPDNFHFETLTNGLQVLTIEDNTVPLATIEITVRNGGYTESPEYDGLSHLYEHMFFKANKDLPSQEAFLERTKELGIVFNGTTSGERVNYFVTLSNLKLAQGMAFMNSAIRYPLFDEQEMKNENPVVDGEFQRAESNPVFFLLQDSDKKMWGDLYSRKNVIGDHDVILTATTEKMKTVQGKYYHPNNSILVVAGDVQHEDVLAKAKAIFGDWQPSGFDPFEKYPIPEFAPLKETTYYITENENARTPIVLMRYHGPDTRKDIPSTYAADVFSFILSQRSSQLQQNLVESGLAMNVNVGYATNKYVGPIHVFMVPNPEKITEAYAALQAEIDRWDSDDYFTDEQLATAKNMLAIDDAYSKEKTSAFIHTVTYWWASASIDYYTSYVENLNKVTREDIKKYVNTYIKNQPHVTGILVSPQMKEDLKINSLETYLNN